MISNSNDVEFICGMYYSLRNSGLSNIISYMRRLFAASLQHLQSDAGKVRCTAPRRYPEASTLAAVHVAKDAVPTWAKEASTKTTRYITKVGFAVTAYIRPIYYCERSQRGVFAYFVYNGSCSRTGCVVTGCRCAQKLRCDWQESA